VKPFHAAARHAYKFWNQCGRPRFGEVYVNMCESRRIFKYKFRECRKTAERRMADRFAEKFVDKDFKSFWREVGKCRKSEKLNLIQCIDGVEGHNVVPHWKSKYEALFNERNFEKNKREFYEDKQSNNEEVSRFCITEADVAKALLYMKVGKASGMDGIQTEALKLGSSVLCKYLCVLFNMCLGCSYIPSKLLQIRLCPILKDKSGDITCSDNYRLVAVASAVSKLFETILLNYIKTCIAVSESQFGFREGYSTDICTDVLKETINVFCDNGSYVFACFVDLSKAFDTVNFWKLFKELERKSVARNVVNLLAYSYSNEELKVAWQGELSEGFSRSSGTRQGSPLSPYLFSIYIDSVLTKLSECDVGCRIRNKTVNHVAYADDIVLLAPSWRGLQQLMSVLAGGVVEKDLLFNFKKTKCMVFPPKFKGQCFLNSIPKFVLLGVEIEFCDSYKHLDHVLVCDRDDASDMKREMRLFFIRTNSLVGLFCKCNVEVKKLLWQAFINGFYGASIWALCKSKLGLFKRAYNNCVKRFFGFDKYCKNRFVYFELNLPTFDTLIANGRVRHCNRRLRLCESNVLISSLFCVYPNCFLNCNS
jgi:hypothetical protein